MHALRATASTVLVLLAAAAIAAGCGSGSDSAKEDDAASAARDGGLAWVADDAVLLGQFDIQPDDVDQALETLDRLPVWSMVKDQVPKGGGDALYERAINDFLDQDEASEDLTWKDDVEPWFEGSGGFAMTGGADVVDEPDTRAILWFDSSDDDAALEMWREGSDKPVEREHGGVTYWVDTGDEQPKDRHVGAFVEDGVLVAGLEPALKRAIDAREQGEDIAGSADTLAVLEGAGKDMHLTVVARTNPLIDAGADALVKEDRAEPLVEGEDGAEVSDRTDGFKRQAATFLASKELDRVLPDDIGFGMAFDDVGLRTRTAWSNPTGPPSSDVSPRELVERMPGNAVTATGSVSDPADMEPYFALLDEGLETFDVRAQDLPEQCPQEARTWCNLGATVLTMLQDEDVREELTSGDPRTSAFAQTFDIASMLQGAGVRSQAGADEEDPPGSAYLYAVEDTGDGSGVAALFEDERLARDLRAVGLEVTVDDSALSLRVVPGSDLARSLRSMSAEEAAAFSSMGIDLSVLASGRPVTFEAHEFEGIEWATFPPSAEDQMRAAIEDGDGTLAESPRYEATLEVLDAPDDPPAWMWIDYGVLVEDLDQLGPELSRYAPTIEANFEHVGGFVGWGSVEEFGGREVGLLELSLPILE